MSVRPQRRGRWVPRRLEHEQVAENVAPGSAVYTDVHSERGLNGTYVSVEPFHLFRYLDERLLAYNLRELDDYGRFVTVLRAAAGRRLTYAELTGKR